MSIKLACRYQHVYIVYFIVNEGFHTDKIHSKLQIKHWLKQDKLPKVTSKLDWKFGRLTVSSIEKLALQAPEIRVNLT